MRIDAHQHFWKFDPIRDSWIDDSMRVLQNDFMPKDLEPILIENNFGGCIAIQADQSEKETAFLLNLASNNSFIKGVVGWVDLKSGSIQERLEYYSDQKYLKGVRHIVQAEKDGFMLERNFVNGVSLLNKFNLTYDILVYPHQLKETIQFVSKFPNQQFVIDHIAKPYIKKGLLKDWEKDIQTIAQFENVSCKVSGMVTEADWEKWTYSQMKPYIAIVFEAFGSSRVLYGSDWPVCQLAANYKNQLSIIETFTDKISESEQQAFFGRNAHRIYKL